MSCPTSTLPQLDGTKSTIVHNLVRWTGLPLLMGQHERQRLFESSTMKWVDALVSSHCTLSMWHLTPSKYLECSGAGSHSSLQSMLLLCNFEIGPRKLTVSNSHAFFHLLVTFGITLASQDNMKTNGTMAISQEVHIKLKIGHLMNVHERWLICDELCWLFIMMRHGEWWWWICDDLWWRIRDDLTPWLMVAYDWIRDESVMTYDDTVMLSDE